MQKYLSDPLGKIFLNMLIMVVIPLVFSSPALGVAQIGDLTQLGRMGVRTIFYFLKERASYMSNYQKVNGRKLLDSRLVKILKSLGVVDGKQVSEDGFIIYRGFWWMLALPQVILAAHLGIVAVVSAWAAIRSSFAWRVVPAGIVAGWLAWTLFEYLFHRWLLHHTRYRLLRKIFWQGMHREHHAYRQMRDPNHHGIHVAISVPVMLLVVIAVAAGSEGGLGLAIAAGWIAGYCSYEALHWLFHSGAEEAAIGAMSPFRQLWEAHTVHHLRRADTNFGFVTMFWDRRLGTFWAEPRTATTSTGSGRKTERG